MQLLFPYKMEEVSCIRGEKERECSRSVPPRLLIAQRGKVSLLVPSSLGPSALCCGLHLCHISHRHLDLLQIPDFRKMWKQSLWWTQVVFCRSGVAPSSIFRCLFMAWQKGILFLIAHWELKEGWFSLKNRYQIKNIKRRGMQSMIVHSGWDKCFFEYINSSASLAINIAIVELEHPPTVNPEQPLLIKDPSLMEARNFCYNIRGFPYKVHQLVCKKKNKKILFLEGYAAQWVCGGFKNPSGQGLGQPVLADTALCKGGWLYTSRGSARPQLFCDSIMTFTTLPVVQDKGQMTPRQHWKASLPD